MKEDARPPESGAAEPKMVVLLKLLAALDEARHSLDGLRERAGGDRLPSTRSLRRYLALLADAGYPWYFDRAKNVYRFPDGYVLRKPDLSANELTGLLTLRGLAVSLGRTLGAGVEELTNRLAPAVPSAPPNAPVRVHVAGVELDPDAEGTFESLQAAQRASQRVTFEYVDKLGRRSERHVDVYGFVISGGRVYAIGYDHHRNATRTFALDGISALRTLPARFSAPRDFDLERFAAHSISGVMSGDELVEVTVRFSPVVARAASAAGVVQDRRIATGDDGSVTIVYRVADVMELVRWTLGWGTEAEIVGPMSARALALALTSALVDRYRVPAEALS
jgi:predicted DNA-binding transcriptional regulator YafY